MRKARSKGSDIARLLEIQAMDCPCGFCNKMADRNQHLRELNVLTLLQRTSSFLVICAGVVFISSAFIALTCCLCFIHLYFLCSRLLDLFAKEATDPAKMPCVRPDSADNDAEPFEEVNPTGRYGRYEDLLGTSTTKKVYRGLGQEEGRRVAWNQVRLESFNEDPQMPKRLFLEVVPNAKKFRYGGIEPEIEEKQDFMFDGVFATGDHSFTPSQAAREGLHDLTRLWHASDSNDLSHESQERIEDQVESRHYKRQATSNSRGTKKKKWAAYLKGSKAD